MKKNIAYRIKIKLILLATIGLLPFGILVIAVLFLSEDIEKESRELSSVLLPRVMYGQKIMTNLQQIRILEYRYCFTNDTYERKSVEKEINSCIRDTRKLIGYYSNRITVLAERERIIAFKKYFEEFISNYRWIAGYMNSGNQDSAVKVVFKQSQANFTRMIRTMRLLTSTGNWQASSTACRNHSKIINAKIVYEGVLPVLLVTILLLAYSLFTSIFRSLNLVFQPKN